MFFIFLSLSLPLLAASATVLQPGSSPDLPPSITLAPRAILPTVTTITLGPRSVYQLDTTKSNGPKGTSIAIVERSEPEGGVDVELGPDLEKKLKEVIKSKCRAESKPDCQTSVEDVLKPEEVGLATRGIGLLAGLAQYLSGLMAAVYTRLLDYDKGWRVVHFEHSEIEKISAASSAQVSSIVFVTGAEDSKPFTATITSANVGPTATDKPQISTVSADGNGHDRGDVVISVPEELGERIDAYWRRFVDCKQSKKRALDVTCLEPGAVRLMEQFGRQGQALQQLALDLNMRMPDIREGEILDSLNRVIETGRALTTLGLAAGALDKLAEICFWIAYEKAVKHSPSVIEYVIPRGDITTTADSPEETGEKKCPEPEHEPVCGNCGGNNGQGRCNGIKEAKGAWKDCPCADGGWFEYAPFKNVQAIRDAQKILANLPTLDEYTPDESDDNDDEDEPDPWCIAGSAPGDNGPQLLPQHYCQCGHKYASKYPINSSDKNNPCPYKSAPGPTITLATWTAQSVDGTTCSYPSTTLCATMVERRQYIPRVTEAPRLDKRLDGNGNGPPVFDDPGDDNDDDDGGDDDKNPPTEKVACGCSE